MTRYSAPEPCCPTHPLWPLLLFQAAVWVEPTATRSHAPASCPQGSYATNTQVRTYQSISTSSSTHFHQVLQITSGDPSHSPSSVNGTAYPCSLPTRIIVEESACFQGSCLEAPSPEGLAVGHRRQLRSPKNDNKEP
eukprot:scpid101423/ scgid18126/ 